MHKKIEDSLDKIEEEMFARGFKLGQKLARQEAIAICEEKMKSSKEDMEDSKKYGVNSCGYGMDLGSHDCASEIANELEQLNREEK